MKVKSMVSGITAMAVILICACEREARVNDKYEILFYHFGFSDKNDNGVIEREAWNRPGVGWEGYDSLAKKIDADKDERVTGEECWQYLMSAPPKDIKVKGLSSMGLDVLPVLSRVWEDDMASGIQKMQALGELELLGERGMEEFRPTGEASLSRYLEDIAGKKRTYGEFDFYWDGTELKNQVDVYLGLFITEKHVTILKAIFLDKSQDQRFRKKILVILIQENSLTEEMCLEMLADKDELKDMQSTAATYFESNAKLDAKRFEELYNLIQEEDQYEIHYGNKQTLRMSVEEVLKRGLDSEVKDSLPSDLLLEMAFDSNLHTFSGIQSRAMDILNGRIENEPELTDKLMEIYKQVHIFDDSCMNFTFNPGANSCGEASAARCEERWIRCTLAQGGKAEVRDFVLDEAADPNELFEYLSFYDQRGLLDSAAFKKREKDMDAFDWLWTWDMEQYLRDFLEQNTAPTPFAKFVKRLLARLDFMKEHRPVSIDHLCLRELGYYENPPQDQETFAYDLSLRILEVPENAASVIFFITDPDGKRWPQVCYGWGKSWGEKRCEAGDGDFIVYLNENNKTVKAELVYYDEAGKFISRSNTFIIRYPGKKQCSP